MHTHRSVAFSSVLFLLCIAPTCLLAAGETDACKVLTAAQVGAAIGVQVAAGTHVTPTFVRTCTWNASGSSPVKFVTLYLQTVAAYDGGKQMATQMAAAVKGASMKHAAIGDDGYYFVAGDQVGLLVKKGNISFKAAVYARLPVEQKEALELALAKEALAKL
ncbi:MAG: hypothetical protein ABI379_12815 [Rhodanobacter sp.]